MKNICKLTGLLALISVFFISAVFAPACNNSSGSSADNSDGYRTITDMRGVEVTIPDDPQRVITISRSLIDTTMYILGVEDTIVGGTFSKPGKKGTGPFTWNGTEYTSSLWIGSELNPNLADVPNVGSLGTGPDGIANIETVASCEPDLLILRDSCDAVEETESFITQVEALDIPVVVLEYFSCNDSPNIETMYEEVRLLGEIFKQEAKAEQIVTTMENAVQAVTSRTQSISESDIKSVLYFGAASQAIDKGGVGYAFGPGTIEVALMEDMVNAENVYSSSGSNLVSAEQMLATDPDVIILCTYSGYHPPRQLNGEKYANIQDMQAIQDGKVYSLMATPCRSERLEFPINLMVAAKAIYPEEFTDIDLESWIHDYIVELYDTDEAMTQTIMDCLLLEYLEII